MTSAISNSLFAEDSPLAGAWLAANAVDKRLSKQSKEKMFSVPIVETTKAIEELTQIDDHRNVNGSSQYLFGTEENTKEGVKLPLRLSSQLLYGVVRIYSSKATTLHGEVSQELNQIKKIFTVNKNITMDPRETNVNDVLKDQMTMENLIDSVNEFNINEVFGNTQDAAVISDVWTQQSSYASAVTDSDIDIGRNAADESMVSSIDDLPRRAELERTDVLQGADDLDLDLNLEKDNDSEIPDFSVPDFVNESFGDIGNNEFDGGFDLPLEELEEQIDQNNTISGYIEEEPISRRRTRRRAAEKITVEYKINNVVRTKQKKLLVDPKIDKTAIDIRNNQSKFEINLKLQRLNSVKVGLTEDQMMLNIFKSLQPDILTVMGTNWRSLKKRKLQNGSSEISIGEEENNGYDDAPDFAVPDIDVENNESADFGAPDVEPELESTVAEADDEQNAFDVESDEDEFELIKASNKSSIKVAESLRSAGKQLTKLEDIIIQDLLSTNKRKNATRTFFEMLVLATADTVNLNQDRLFGEIEIESKPNLYQKFL